MIDGYKLDVVCCIDATRPMSIYSRWVTEFICKYMETTIELGIEHGYIINDIDGVARIKFIAFRDMNCCPIPFEMSRFFDFHEFEAIKEYINNLSYTGGYGYSNLLEAISLACTSEWRNETRVRKAVIAFSCNKAREIGLNKDIFLRYSPIFIPDMQTLSALWEDTCDYSVLKKLGSNYINNRGWNWKALYLIPQKNCGIYNLFLSWNGFYYYPDPFSGEQCFYIGKPDISTIDFYDIAGFPWNSW